MWSVWVGVMEQLDDQARPEGGTMFDVMLPCAESPACTQVA